MKLKENQEIYINVGGAGIDATSAGQSLNGGYNSGAVESSNGTTTISSIYSNVSKQNSGYSFGLGENCKGGSAGGGGYFRRTKWWRTFKLLLWNGPGGIWLHWELFLDFLWLLH